MIPVLAPHYHENKMIKVNQYFSHVATWVCAGLHIVYTNRSEP